jgi:hypothetical protein
MYINRWLTQHDRLFMLEATPYPKTFAGEHLAALQCSCTPMRLHA